MPTRREFDREDVIELLTAHCSLLSELVSRPAAFKGRSTSLGALLSRQRSMTDAVYE